MDINKIHESMKVLKEECKKYKECKDCIFYDNASDTIACYLDRDPASWKEDEIIENNCTTAHQDGLDEWFDRVIRCDDCEGTFMLSGLTDKDTVIGKFCPHCGKKIIDYKEDKEDGC